MCEDLEQKYNDLVKEYLTTISKKFSPEDFVTYNEVLFSAHSCAIEGNSYSVSETKALKEFGRS